MGIWSTQITECQRIAMASHERYIKEDRRKSAIDKVKKL